MAIPTSSSPSNSGGGCSSSSTKRKGIITCRRLVLSFFIASGLLQVWLTQHLVQQEAQLQQKDEQINKLVAELAKKKKTVDQHKDNLKLLDREKHNRSLQQKDERIKTETVVANTGITIDANIGRQKSSSLPREKAVEPHVSNLNSNANTPTKQEGQAVSISSRKTTTASTTATTKTPPEFPETKFTKHVQGILAMMENTVMSSSDGEKNSYNPIRPTLLCFGYRLVVDKPYTVPSRIECPAPTRQFDPVWCNLFQNMFQKNSTRILPFNVTVGIHMADMLNGTSDRAWGHCIGSSAPDGAMSMNNYQDAMAQSGRHSREAAVNRGEKGWTFQHNNTKRWEDRHTIPVFRGHPRMFPPKPPCPDHMDNSPHHRVRAGMFSLKHPELLDVFLTPIPGDPCSRFNATNGLDQLFRWGKYSRHKYTSGLPPKTIHPSEYYTNYQTALVLGGFGAAFRTNRHLAAGQAVILQKFRYEEWFAPYMTPWVHYIPLKEDLSDIKEVMEWVRDHPVKVREIAKNGKKFYWEYLSFEESDEHWYELLWRLSLLLHEKGSKRLKVGNTEEVFTARWRPDVFERNAANGTYALVSHGTSDIQRSK